MAYITNHTLGKLCATVEINFSIDKASFLKHVYPDEELYYIFNSREHKYLFIYANLLEDEDKFASTYYQEVPEKIDYKQYVNEKVGKSIFHLYSDCSLISKNFKDFNIPAELRELDKIVPVITDYRNWFKESNFEKKLDSGEIKPYEIIREYNEKFARPYKIKEESENFELTKEIKNGKKVLLDEKFDITKFEKELQRLKRSFDEEFDSHELIKLSKFSSHKDDNDVDLRNALLICTNIDLVSIAGGDAVRNKLRSGDLIKRDLKDLISNYLKWTKNADTKSFNPITLENFGLKCCVMCNNQKADNELKALFKENISHTDPSAPDAPNSSSKTP